MDAILVDTNIFIRFFVADNPKQFTACEKLFKDAAKGKVKLMALPIVIAEIAWLLGSYYHEVKQEIAQKLKTILLFKGLEIVDRNILIIAIQLFENKNIDFTDAYVSSWLTHQKISKIYSYDRDFDNIGDISRIEP